MKQPIEKNPIFRKILGVICIVVLVLNIILRFGFKTYGDSLFWAIILITALIAWPIMNYMKK